MCSIQCNSKAFVNINNDPNNNIIFNISNDNCIVLSGNCQTGDSNYTVIGQCDNSKLHFSQ